MNRSKNFLAAVAALLVAGILAAVLPATLESFALGQCTQYVIFALFGLSLAYVWGDGGVMCLGQSTFFGLGAYTLALVAPNIGSTNWALAAAILVPALAAGGLGYFMFYGRLNDVYMGIITLVVCLICSKVIGHMSGPEYALGVVAIGGYNGIQGIEPLTELVSGKGLESQGIFCVAVLACAIIFASMKLLQISKFGRVTIAVRESELRAALLGYDVRRHKLLVFALGGAVSGFAGGLFASFQSFVDPNVFSLALSAQCLVWVLAGGRGTLLGPLIASVLLQVLNDRLAQSVVVQPSLVIGSILLLVVVLAPEGLLPIGGRILHALRLRAGRVAPVLAAELDPPIDSRA